MYERANYYKSKFIRNGIAGIAISGFLIYNAVTLHKTFSPAAIIFPFAALTWLYFGLRINQKLKLKSPSNEVEISNEKISFRYVEFLLSLLVIISLFLSLKHWAYANYLIIATLVIYICWLYTQMKLLKNYFKGV